MNKRLHWLASIGALAALLAAPAHALTVFASDFEAATIPAEISPGVAALTGVQGYAGLGAAGRQFGGSFLRSPTGNEVSLTLSGLPTHTSLSIGFLFAAIDSLDGTGSFPQGDFLNIKVDGVSIFRESFANAQAGDIQSYVPPAGGELARRVDLGFSGPGSFYTDSAYDFFIEPRLQNLAHSGSTLTLSWIMEGPGIQSLEDESWAMDRLEVTINAVPEPATWALMLGGVALLGLARRRAGTSG
jgi:PEP-CTERM motif